MITLGEVVIVGGGCYGSFYLRQLARARAAGAATWRRVLVVDRDPGCRAASAIVDMSDTEFVQARWSAFLDRWLGAPTRRADDMVVPSPLMPHLFADWVRTRATARWPEHRVEMVPVERAVGTPFDQLHPGDGNRYVSHADWICPVHCIEPATCPRIRAPRSWEMTETIAEWAGQGAADEGTPALGVFHCAHVTYGVGMVAARAVRDAADALDARLARHGSAEMVLASVSSCHGAIGVLRAEAR